MVAKRIRWQTTCNRFVAFLDIMGFKDMVFRSNHQEVRKVLESFQPTVAAIKQNAREALYSGKKYKFNRHAIAHKMITRPISFSDSIILVSNDDSFDSALGIILEVEWIFSAAMIQGIPIKGAIAFGEQTSDFLHSLHFGRPLIDAFELQNELLLYGVVLHHTMEKYLLEVFTMKRFENFCLFKYHAPMRSGNISHYLVLMPFYGENRESIERISGLYKNVSGSPRLYVDNTLNCVFWLKNHKAEFYQ